jgi:hypothetical protein
LIISPTSSTGITQLFDLSHSKNIPNTIVQEKNNLVFNQVPKEGFLQIPAPSFIALATAGIAAQINYFILSHLWKILTFISHSFSEIHLK